MTKHETVNDEALKNPLMTDDLKIEVMPKMIDHSIALGSSQLVQKPKNKMKARTTKAKVPVKRTGRLGKTLQCLFDLEEGHEPEKTLNVDFGLYQMENY